MLVVPSPTADHRDITLLLGGWLRARTPAGITASLGLVSRSTT